MDLTQAPLSGARRNCRRLGQAGLALALGLGLSLNSPVPVQSSTRADGPIGQVRIAKGVSIYLAEAGDRLAPLWDDMILTKQERRKARSYRDEARRSVAVKASDRERHCLATAIYFEARGESEKGQKAVAEVILTRTEMKDRPKSICGVVYENSHRYMSCQFTFTCDGKSDVPRDMASWSRAKKVAAAVLAKGSARPITRRATHYHANYVSPSWSSKMSKTAQVGTHIFFKDPRARFRSS